MDYLNTQSALRRLWLVVIIVVAGGLLAGSPSSTHAARAPFPFLWIANAGEDTVSKFDSANNKEAARYRTWFGPEDQLGYQGHLGDAWAGAAPSRTAVDPQTGDAYVLNRHFDGRPALLIKILRQGGIDRNGNGVIDTSSDVNNDGLISEAELKPLADSNENGRIDLNEIQDERIAWAVTVGDSGGIGRALCIGTDRHLWVGLYSASQYWKVGGMDGAILAGPVNVSWSPYGCLIDASGTLWSASLSSTLGKIANTHTNGPYQVESFGLPADNYGIALGNQVYLGDRDGGRYIQFDPVTNTASQPGQGPGFSSTGISVDGDGNILTGPASGGGITKYAPDGTVIWSSPTQFSGWSVGVVIDQDNNVWQVSLDGSRLMKYRSTDGAPLGVFPVGDSPYTYSDASGLSASNIIFHTVTATAGANGSISPASRSVNLGAVATFTVTPNAGYAIESVTGCGGNLAEGLYTTGIITEDCTVTASFSPATATLRVTATAGPGGIISPATQSVNPGATTTFTITPNRGYVAQVAGCGGTLTDNTYTTGSITAACTVVAEFTPTLTADVPALTTPALPNSVMNVPYGTVVTAAGGQPSYTYTASGLPSGLSLSTDGTLGGVPAGSGTFDVDITVTDRLGQSSVRRYTLTVAEIVLVTTALPDGLTQAPYQQTLAALGGRQPYTFSATGLPLGLTLTSKGVLSGVPMQPGVSAIQITVTDEQGRTATQPLLLTLRAASFTRSNPTQPDQSISVALRTGPNEFNCTIDQQNTVTLNLGEPGAPVLGPDGITLPYGLLKFAVQGCAANRTTLTVTVVYPNALRPGTEYWKFGPTTPVPNDQWYVLSGAVIKGNVVTYTLIDGGLGDTDLTANAAIADPGGPGIPNLRIGGTPPAQSPLSRPYRAALKARYGSTSPAALQLAASGADDAYLWSIVEGVLPPGLTLSGASEEVTLSGVPTETGIYTFTVQVIDRQNGNTLTQEQYTVEITDTEIAAALSEHHYGAILNRVPDPEGDAYWQGVATQMAAQGIAPDAIFSFMAEQFFASTEYQARNSDDPEYVADLYQAFLNRAPDITGLNYWTGQLTEGQSRVWVMEQLRSSPEFETALQAWLGGIVQ